MRRNCRRFSTYRLVVVRCPAGRWRRPAQAAAVALKTLAVVGGRSVPAVGRRPCGAWCRFSGLAGGRRRRARPARLVGDRRTARRGRHRLGVRASQRRVPPAARVDRRAGGGERLARLSSRRRGGGQGLPRLCRSLHGGEKEAQRTSPTATEGRPRRVRRPARGRRIRGEITLHHRRGDLPCRSPWPRPSSAGDLVAVGTARAGGPGLPALRDAGCDAAGGRAARPGCQEQTAYAAQRMVNLDGPLALAR